MHECAKDNIVIVLTGIDRLRDSDECQVIIIFQDLPFREWIFVEEREHFGLKFCSPILQIVFLFTPILSFSLSLTDIQTHMRERDESDHTMT